MHLRLMCGICNRISGYKNKSQIKTLILKMAQIHLE